MVVKFLNPRLYKYNGGLRFQSELDDGSKKTGRRFNLIHRFPYTFSPQWRGLDESGILKLEGEIRSKVLPVVEKYFPTIKDLLSYQGKNEFKNLVLQNIGGKSESFKKTSSNEKSIAKPTEESKAQYDVEWYRSKNWNDPEFPAKESMFFIDPKSANTKLFFAPSKSGKTTLLVKELNKLAANKQELEQYTSIIFITESDRAEPLDYLNKKAFGNRLIILTCFTKNLLHFLARCNSNTNNRFKFLVIFDDVLKLRGDELSQAILTLRNCRISTVILIQYAKLLNPAQRHSIHDYFVLKLGLTDWEFFIKDFIEDLVRDYMTKLGDPSALTYRLSHLVHRMQARCEDRIMQYCQTDRKLIFYSRGKPLGSKKGRAKEESDDKESNPLANRIGGGEGEIDLSNTKVQK